MEKSNFDNVLDLDAEKQFINNELISKSPMLPELIKEEEDLGKKIFELNKIMFRDNIVSEVGSFHAELLALQHSTMLAYRRALNLRINDLK